MRALKSKCLCGAEGVAIKSATEFVFGCGRCKLLVYGSYRDGMSFPFVIVNGRELDVYKEVSNWVLNLLKSDGDGLEIAELLEVIR